MQQRLPERDRIGQRGVHDRQQHGDCSEHRHLEAQIQRAGALQQQREPSGAEEQSARCRRTCHVIAAATSE